MSVRDEKRKKIWLRSAALAVMVTLTGLVMSCAQVATTGREAGERAAAHRDETTRPPQVTGAVTLTFTGTYGDSARIFSPWGISFGVDGTLYVCDRDRSSIIRLDSEGNTLSRFSGYGSRVERLYSPIDVCSTAGMSIYAVDGSNSRVLRFDRNLKNAFVMYRRDSSGNRLFGSFNGLAFDKTTGDLYITDRDSGALIRIDMLGHTIKSRGAFGTGRESLREPAGLDVAEDGRIIIADRGTGAVAVLDHFAAVIRHIGADALEAPVDVASLPDGSVAVADRSGIVILTESGVPAGRAGYGEDRDMTPRSLAYREGKLFVSDGASGAILAYDVK